MPNQRDDNRVPNIAGVSSITFTGSVEPAVNPSTHELLVSEAETVPTDSTKNNPSITLSNADEVVASTKILTQTINGRQFASTLSFNAAGNFLGISSSVEI